MAAGVVILQQRLQTAQGVSERSNSNGPNKHLGSGGPWEPGPQSVLSRARPRNGPSARAPRALRVHWGQPGPASRRADRQTPRCRAVSGCARVCESKEENTPPPTSHPARLAGSLAGRGTARGSDWWAPGPRALRLSGGPSLRHWSGFMLHLLTLSRERPSAHGLWQISCKITYLKVFFFFFGVEKVHC